MRTSLWTLLVALYVKIDQKIAGNRSGGLTATAQRLPTDFRYRPCPPSAFLTSTSPDAHIQRPKVLGEISEISGQHHEPPSLRASAH
jgi:hypothetical protein